MSNNNLSNFHICIGDDGLERANYIRRTGYIGSGTPSIFKSPSKMMVERHYPDPISAAYEKIRLMDKHFLRSDPYVFKIHNSWVVTYPPGGYLDHRLATFTTWDDAILFANEVSIRD